MSSTGIDKARSRDQRIADNTIDITKQIIEDTKVFNSTSPAFALSGEQGSSEGSAAGNYLAKSGDVRLGPMGNEFRIVEVIDDTISVSISTPNYVPWIILTPEGGLPDDLVTIIPGESVFLNQEIILQGGNLTNDTTLKNSGNIITPDGGNLAIAFGDIVRLYYSQLLSAWVVAWFSSNVGGGGGFSDPLTQLLITLSTATLPATTTVNTNTATEFQIILDENIEFDFTGGPAINRDQVLTIFILQDGTGGFTIDWGAKVTNPPTIGLAPNESTTVVLVSRNEGTSWTVESAVSGGSSVEFFGPWTANHDAGIQSLVNLAAVALVDAGGLPRGSISGDAGATAVRLSLTTANKFIISDVLTDIVSFDDTTGLTIEGTHVINMGNNIINQISELQLSNSNSHTPSNELSIAFDNIDDALKYSVALTTDSHRFYADTDLLASISRVGTNEGLLSIQSVTATFLQATKTLLLSTFNNVSPTNGEVWRDSGDGKFKFRENSTTQELGGLVNEIVDGDSSVLVTDTGIPANAKIDFILNGGAVGVFTPISFLPAIPIDMITGLNILNTDNLRFLRNSDTIPISATGFVPDALGLRLNLENSADIFTLTYNSATITHQWNNSAQTSPNLILNNTLTIQDSSTDSTSLGQFSRNGDDVTILTSNGLKNMKDIGAGSPLTTKGDVFTFDTANARLPVGSNGQVLTANSAVSLGVEWSTAGADLLPLNNVWTGFNTYTNQVNLNANVNIGDQITDTITGVSRIARDWIPDVDSVRLLGDSTHYFVSVFFDTLNINNGAGTVRADANGLEIRANLTGDSIELQTEGQNTRARFENGSIEFFEPLTVNDNIIIDNGSIIKSQTTQEIGFSVTDENTSSGTRGTLQMPRTDDATPTAAELDTEFGSALGDHGLVTLGGLPATPLFVIKVGTSPSTWRGILLFPSGSTTAIEFT